VGEKVRNVIKDRNLKSLDKRKTDSLLNRREMKYSSEMCQGSSIPKRGGHFPTGSYQIPDE